MHRLRTIMLITLVLLGVGGIAAASIPDASGVIHGCRKNSDGSVKVIDSDAGQMCGNGYTALNWSQTGPAGPQGSPGMSGYEVVFNTTSTGNIAVVMCPLGKKLLGGGGGSGEASNGNNTNYNMVLSESRPMYPPDVDGWYVSLQAVNGALPPVTVTAFAICAQIS